MAGRGRISSWSLMDAILTQINQLLCYFSTKVAAFWRFVGWIYAKFFRKSNFFNLESGWIWLSRLQLFISPLFKQNLLLFIISLIFLQNAPTVDGWRDEFKTAVTPLMDIPIYPENATQPTLNFTYIPIYSPGVTSYPFPVIIPIPQKPPKAGLWPTILYMPKPPPIPLPEPAPYPIPLPGPIPQPVPLLIPMPAPGPIAMPLGTPMDMPLIFPAPVSPPLLLPMRKEIAPIFKMNAIFIGVLIFFGLGIISCAATVIVMCENTEAQAIEHEDLNILEMEAGLARMKEKSRKVRYVKELKKKYANLKKKYEVQEKQHEEEERKELRINEMKKTQRKTAENRLKAKIVINNTQKPRPPPVPCPHRIMNRNEQIPPEEYQKKVDDNQLQKSQQKRDSPPKPRDMKKTKDITGKTSTKMATSKAKGDYERIEDKRGDYKKQKERRAEDEKPRERDTEKDKKSREEFIEKTVEQKKEEKTPEKDISPIFESTQKETTTETTETMSLPSVKPSIEEMSRVTTTEEPKKEEKEKQKQIPSTSSPETTEESKKEEKKEEKEKEKEKEKEPEKTADTSLPSVKSSVEDVSLTTTESVKKVEQTTEQKKKEEKPKEEPPKTLPPLPPKAPPPKVPSVTRPVAPKPPKMEAEPPLRRYVPPPLEKIKEQQSRMTKPPPPPFRFASAHREFLDSKTPSYSSRSEISPKSTVTRPPSTALPSYFQSVLPIGNHPMDKFAPKNVPPPPAPKVAAPKPAEAGKQPKAAVSQMSSSSAGSQKKDLAPLYGKPPAPRPPPPSPGPDTYKKPGGK